MGQKGSSVCNKNGNGAGMSGVTQSNATKLPPLFPGGSGSTIRSDDPSLQQESSPLYSGKSHDSKHGRGKSQVLSSLLLESGNVITGQKGKLRKAITFPCDARHLLPPLPPNQRQHQRRQERHTLPHRRSSLDDVGAATQPLSPTSNLKQNTVVGTESTAMNALHAEQSSPCRDVAPANPYKPPPPRGMQVDTSRRSGDVVETDRRNSTPVLSIRGCGMSEFSAFRENSLNNVSRGSLAEKKHDGMRQSFKALARLHTPPPPPIVRRNSSKLTARRRPKPRFPGIALLDGEEEAEGAVETTNHADYSSYDVERPRDAVAATALKTPPLSPPQMPTMTSTLVTATTAAIKEVEARGTSENKSRPHSAASTSPEELHAVSMDDACDGYGRESAHNRWLSKLVEVLQPVKWSEGATPATTSCVSAESSEASSSVAWAGSSGGIAMNDERSGDLVSFAHSEKSPIFSPFGAAEKLYAAVNSIDESVSCSLRSTEKDCGNNSSMLASARLDNDTMTFSSIAESEGGNDSSSSAATVVVALLEQPPSPLSLLSPINPLFSPAAGSVEEMMFKPAVEKLAGGGGGGRTRPARTNFGVDEHNDNANANITKASPVLSSISINSISSEDMLREGVTGNRDGCGNNVNPVHDKSVDDDDDGDSDDEKDGGPLEGFYPSAFKCATWRRSVNNVVFILTSQNSSSSSSLASDDGVNGTEQGLQRALLRPRVVRGVTTPPIKPHHNTLMRRHLTPNAPPQSNGQSFIGNHYEKGQKQRMQVWRHGCVHVDSGTGLELSRIYRPTSSRYAPDPARMHRPAGNTFGLHRRQKCVSTPAGNAGDGELWSDDDDDEADEWGSEDEEEEEEECEEEEEEEEEVSSNRCRSGGQRIL